MKSYNKDKERDVWYKYKSMGKKKFVIYTTLSFVVCMIITLTIPYVLFNYLFGIPNYSPRKVLLTLVTYTIIAVFIGIKMSAEIWVRRTIEFEGVQSIELEDVELKGLILKGEKIMAAKRYRIITGTGLKESIRYVDLLSKHYLKKI